MKFFMSSAVLLPDCEENSTSFIPIWVAIFFCILLPLITRRNETVAKRSVKRRNNQEEKNKMTELAKKFIEKDCIIYLFNGSQYTGVVKEVSDGAILIDNGGVQEIINLDFVARLREHPRKKNGKKRSVILD